MTHHFNEESQTMTSTAIATTAPLRTTTTAKARALRALVECAQLRRGDTLWQLAVRLGLDVRLFPSELRAAGPLVADDVVGLPNLSVEVRGSMLLEALAVVALRAAKLTEEPFTIDELAATLARRIGWRMTSGARWWAEASQVAA